MCLFQNWEIKLLWSSPLKFVCVLSITNKSLFMKTEGAKLFSCSKDHKGAPRCVLFMSRSYKGQLPHQASHFLAFASNHDISFPASVYGTLNMKLVSCRVWYLEDA